MTIELSKKTQALLEQVLGSGSFESAEAFLQYSLTRTLSEQDILEDEVFTNRIKASLARSQKAIDEGRVYTIPHGKLADTIAARHKEREKASQ